MKIRFRTLSADQVPERSELSIALAFDGSSPRLPKALAGDLRKAKATGDLKVEFRKTSLFHRQGGSGPQRLGFVGMGSHKELTAERLRRAAAVAQSMAEARGCARFELSVDPRDLKPLTLEHAGRALAEGLILGAYRYQKPSKDKPKPRKGQRCDLVLLSARGDSASSEFRRGVKFGTIGAEATCFARDLENKPGNLATPTVLAREAKKFAGPGLKVRVMNEAEMKRLGMNALLGVSRGSVQPAKLILMDYHPRGAKETVCVVGKGLTFDSGGISIKPSARMDEMRYDMCGGGAVLGLFHAIANGGLSGGKKLRVIGVVPSSENMPDADAQKPGDVVTAFDGTTIEVLNTDAEGRLILADAIAYAIKTYKPDRVIDLATLTGAVVVALGHEVAGVMGNDDSLIEGLIDAGKSADEQLWQLPLWEVHREQTKSKFADVANINGSGHGGGSINGGAFLSYFVGDTPWAHLDIAGAAWGGMPKDYYRGGAAGFAVRALMQWLRNGA